MTYLILRTQRRQEQLEGRQHFHDWKDTDYAVVDGMRRVGPIYQNRRDGGRRATLLISLPQVRAASGPTRGVVA